MPENQPKEVPQGQHYTTKLKTSMSCPCDIKGIQHYKAGEPEFSLDLLTQPRPGSWKASGLASQHPLLPDQIYQLQLQSWSCPQGQASTLLKQKEVSSPSGH